MSETISANRPVITKAVNYSSAQTDTVIWSVTSGMRIALAGIFVSTDGATTLQLEANNVDVLPPTYLPANYGFSLPSSAGTPIWIGAADEDLTLTFTGSVNVSVLVWGYETQANG